MKKWNKFLADTGLAGLQVVNDTNELEMFIILICNLPQPKSLNRVLLFDYCHILSARFLEAGIKAEAMRGWGVTKHMVNSSMVIKHQYASMGDGHPPDCDKPPVIKILQRESMRWSIWFCSHRGSFAFMSSAWFQHRVRKFEQLPHEIFRTRFTPVGR